MNKEAVSLVLLAAGVMLTICGVSEMNSFASDTSRMFMGHAPHISMWMIVAGVVLVLLGALSDSVEL